MERPIIPAFPPAPELGDTVEVFDQKAFALVASLEPQRKKFNEVAQYVGEKSAEVEDNLAQTRVEVGKAEAEVSKAEAEAIKAAGFAQDSEASALSAFNSEQLARGYAEAVEDVIAGDTYVISEDTATIEITGVGTRSNPLKASLRQNGSASLSRYDLASAEATDELDLAQQQVFRVDASTPRTISLTNEPETDRAMTVVIHITGNSPVTWPASIVWDDGEAPELGDDFTRVILFWDGVIWTGVTGVAR